MAIEQTRGDVMLRTYEVHELEEMETLEDGVDQLLKVDEMGFRVWFFPEDARVDYEIRVGETWYDLAPTADGNWVINT